MSPEPILIVGTGSLATLFAARLAAAGTPVTILGTWNAALQAFHSHGAGVGTGPTYPLHATDDPEECRGARLALVLVKAWQTERAALQLRSCLADDGLALTLQNGLGNREILGAALGERRVAQGVTTAGATLLGPGRVREAGEGTISIQAHPQIGTATALLRAAGFEVVQVEDVRALVWGKLVINAAINPLTALLRVPNGELLERSAARTVMGRLACEAAAVANALGIPLGMPDPAGAAEAVAQKTSENQSSMLQDVRRGAPTEIDAICGAVVRAGTGCRVPTPFNELVWRLVQALAPA